MNGHAQERGEGAGEAVFREVRFHGRGGQGAVSAAALLALAAFEDGYEAQAFPKFGSERRGAPVEAYVRIATVPIRAHNQVYAPDAVVIQDGTLLHSEAVLQGLVRDGLVVLNGERPPENAQGGDGFRWVCVPANRMSETILGRTLPNTVLLGALAVVSGWVSLKALEQAIARHLAGKGEAVVKANIEALREGYRVAATKQEQVS